MLVRKYSHFVRIHKLLIFTHPHSVQGKEIDVLFVEGIHVFQCPELFDMKIFVDVDSDERLGRRIERDTNHRGRTLHSVLLEWRKFVKPNFDRIIFLTKRFADVIVPRGAQNKMCLGMVKSHILHAISDNLR